MDIWLRETESVAAGTPAAPGIAPPATGELATPTPRDIAEGLLDLQVWDMVSSRQLASPEQGPERADATAAQLWAQHIFAALEPKA